MRISNLINPAHTDRATKSKTYRRKILYSMLQPLISRSPLRFEGLKLFRLMSSATECSDSAILREIVGMLAEDDGTTVMADAEGDAWGRANRPGSRLSFALA